MNSYEQHAQHMVDEGVWTPEEAESWVGNTMYADWRDFQAELELEAREVECDEESEEEMSKTTIYRCDLCGTESMKAPRWRIRAEIARKNWQGGTNVYDRGDYCPKCQDLVDKTFDDAWEKLKGGAE